METAILLAVAASLCTATSSVCQRMGAKTSQATGFDAGLVFRLARQPVWLLGIASMTGGFVLQLIALHFGALALVQPILAAELVFVFGYLALAGSGRVKRRDWLAATVMSAGIGVFLRVASPSGGRLHAPGSSWLVAGLATAGVVVLAVAVAFGLGRRPAASGTRRAAVLGAATGISWGFMAAVIKELSSHLDDGVGAIFSSWSLYLLIAAGAATMLLASHALAAGPLAASQPGFTILDPLSASLLGTFLFAEHIRTGAADLAGEALALAAVIAAAAVLSHSCHVAGENSRPVEPAASSAPDAITRDIIRENHVAGFEESCLVAQTSAEPGTGAVTSRCRMALISGIGIMDNYEAGRRPRPRRGRQIDACRPPGGDHPPASDRTGPALLAAGPGRDASRAVGSHPARARRATIVDHGRGPRTV
jgi:hypothetical protein